MNNKYNIFDIYLLFCYNNINWQMVFIIWMSSTLWTVTACQSGMGKWQTTVSSGELLPLPLRKLRAVHAWNFVKNKCCKPWTQALLLTDLGTMPVSRMRMRPWLEDKIDSNTITGLVWVDKVGEDELFLVFAYLCFPWSWSWMGWKNVNKFRSRGCW